MICNNVVLQLFNNIDHFECLQIKMLFYSTVQRSDSYLWLTILPWTILLYIGIIKHPIAGSFCFHLQSPKAVFTIVECCSPKRKLEDMGISPWTITSPFLPQCCILREITQFQFQLFKIQEDHLVYTSQGSDSHIYLI